MSRSELPHIEKTVQQNIDRYFNGGEPPFFIAAVSGGVDSMCQLFVLKQLGIPALVSHINYQKRGEDSHKDARLIERITSKWGFESHITEVNPEEAEGRNFQQWARNIRYSIFRDLAREYDADAIVLGHHEDDQIETILQKLFRGAGLSSLTGMSVWNGELFRPLLDISREELEEYAAENDIPYRTDQSNLESDFARNFLRNEWEEGLSDFFPGWKKNVLRIAEKARQHEDAIGWIADRLVDEEGIQRDLFHSLDSANQKSVILYLLKQKQDGIQISKGSLGQIEKLENLQTGQEIELMSEISIHRDRDHYRILAATEKEEFHSRTIEKHQLENSGINLGAIHLKIEELTNYDFANKLYLDANKIKWPITIRRWEAGDYIQPLGMEGRQLVSDHLTNRKISSAYKDRALVIESFEETICAIIFPPIKNRIMPGTISENVKCDSDTEYSLKIKYRS